MRREDMISILCKLKYCSDDFSTIATSFLFDFSERSYEIKFHRENGRIINFNITDKGEVINENN